MEFLSMINFGLACKDIAPVIKFVKSIFTLIQWLIPIGLILMGSIDLGKAVLSSDDKEIKQATSKLIKRAIAAVAVFFIVLLVKLVMGLVSQSNGSSNNIMSCWDKPDSTTELGQGGNSNSIQ